MPDGVLSIGAVFDKARLEGDFSEAAQVVRAATEGWSTSFESSKKATRDAMDAMSASIKQMGAQATPASLAYADSLRRVAVAQREVRQASILMRDSTVDSGQAALAAMAAQRDLAAAQTESAAAQTTFTEEQTAAARESEISSSVIVGGFQRVAIAAREAGAAMQTQATEAMGGFKSMGLAGGLMGLINGPIMALMAGGMFVHFIDGMAEVGVQLAHLHTMTGMTVEDLAGLREMARESRTDFDVLGTGLVRMEKNLADSITPTRQLQEALGGVNLKIADLQGLTPEEKLGKIAVAFAATQNEGNRAAAAIAIFGRGGKALIPILTDQGAALTDNMKKIGAQTGWTNEAAEGSERWSVETARLAMSFHSALIPVLDVLPEVLMAVVGAVRAVWAVFESVSALIVSVFQSVFQEIAVSAGLVTDAVTGQWSKMMSDAKSASGSVADVWVRNFSYIRDEWKAAYADFTKPIEVPKLSGDASNQGQGDESGGVNGAAAQAALKADVEELNKLKVNHRLTLQEEEDFWKKKLAAATEGSDEYVALMGKLAPLMQRTGHAVSEKADLKADEAELLSLRVRHRMTLDEEADFWRKKLAINKGGLEEYVAIHRKIIAAQVAAQGPQTISTVPGAETADFSKIGTEAQENATSLLDVVREQMAEKQRIAQEDFRNTEQDLGRLLGLHKIFAADELTDLKAAADKEYAIELGLVREKQMIDMGDRRAYERDLIEEEQLTRQHARQIEQIEKKMALQNRAIWQGFQDNVRKVMTQITAEFNASIAKLIITSKGFGQSMVTILRGMTEALAEQLLQMGEKWLAHEILVRVQHLLTATINKTTDATAAVASQAKTAAANVGNVISNTAVAASGAAASQASIPIVGPTLAVAAAAAMESLGTGWVAQAAFDSGGIMPHMGFGYNMSGQPERVLSPSQTRNFETLVNTVNHGGSRNARLNQTNNFGSGVTPEMLKAHTNQTMQRLRSMLRPEAFR